MVLDRFGTQLGHVQYMTDDSWSPTVQRIRAQWHSWLKNWLKN